MSNPIANNEIVAISKQAQDEFQEIESNLKKDINLAEDKNNQEQVEKRQAVLTAASIEWDLLNNITQKPIWGKHELKNLINSRIRDKTRSMGIDIECFWKAMNKITKEP
jgi:hypothetical protein